MPTQNRRIRVFVSSTFRDMMGERDELMTHAWPELRRFCRERQVELVEVDLRWGIAEEQSTRKETLKLCLDEIRACRPFFIGLLGERYGWVPGDDAFTADLREEQPWLKDLHGKSVTELEILHGVLNNPEMAGRAFFYFRDPKFVESVPANKKTDFAAENAESAEKQRHLKERIRARFGVPPSGGPHARSPTEPLKAGTPNFPDRVNAELQTLRPRLHENYPDPIKLATFVLEDLKAAIEGQFPIENIPDALTREARDHEAFAETRRRTYIDRPDYFEALDRHALGGASTSSPSPPSEGGEGRGEVGNQDKPLVLLGDSGSGKSALVANWISHWRERNPKDFIFQHYIGGTPDSAEHWRLMTRLIAEIKRWSGDPEELPRTHDDLLKTFPVWLAKARIKAERAGVRCILVLDALNQLEDRDHARLLGWLPSHPFTGALRLIVSTLPGDTLDAVTQRGWKSLRVDTLAPDERRRMIADYLKRFGKKLDAPRLERIAAAPAAANPLYLKILLDELRVTGTHERLDERLQDYLAATDIPALLKKVLARYQHDYERDRPGLVSKALGLIWAARRGLTESELLRLLRPKSESGNQKSEMSGMPQLPPAIWNPLRAAMEENLVDRGGILNFAHDFLRAAVETAFVPDQDKRDKLRLQLANDFEQQTVSDRSCDELPWLLWQAKQRDRLRACLLDIDRFLEIQKRGEEELMSYWIWLKAERTMGRSYLDSFERWSSRADRSEQCVASAANQLAFILNYASHHTEAEGLLRRALAVDEQRFGPDHPSVGVQLADLGLLLSVTERPAEAEPLMRRALAIAEKNYGPVHAVVAVCVSNLALMLRSTGRLSEVEPLYRRSLAINEQRFGPNHSTVAISLSNLAQHLQDTNRLTEAESLMRRALAIDEQVLGKEHPNVGADLNNLALLFKDAGRLGEAEPIMRRALAIDEQTLGKEHPRIAGELNNLALVLQAEGELAEAEPLMRRALAIREHSCGPEHLDMASSLSSLGALLLASAIKGQSLIDVSNRLAGPLWIVQNSPRIIEAERLLRRAAAIRESRSGPVDVRLAKDLSNLAALLGIMCRFNEAEPLSRRGLEILLESGRAVGHPHPHLNEAINNYAGSLQAMGRSQEQVLVRLNAICKPYGIQLGE